MDSQMVAAMVVLKVGVMADHWAGRLAIAMAGHWAALMALL